MSKQVIWTKEVMQAFEEAALLNEDERYIIESRCLNVPISQQAVHLSISESSVSNRIKELKLKYDAVQKEHPEIFPKRKKSKKELWMDTH